MYLLIFVLVDDEKDKKEEKLVPEKILAIIEEAYPNSLTIDDMSRRFKSETEIVRNMILELVNKKLVKSVGAGVPGAAGLDSAAGLFYWFIILFQERFIGTEHSLASIEWCRP